ncbi:hypothetical protein CDG77_31365 [Nostoc sp. 'Peltigera membranacea cyanobiont' 213]|uniref:hypothetical protein n=1 Tax=Nostoc sp. 'Peltigera membranacea cyanobiont' 213 TaxID=2014530 RepID=UPI000B958C40|nr:hypothetical protein [Nostoc sp. 'Peltigera membranacea cyanobiont' 213]OYD87089.1 hypothetical protein CDG77_31365 [Nostoc sp. 'Peltigera membranacea cyanobiont' 213]
MMIFGREITRCDARISHKLQAFDRAEGQKGKNQGTLKSPLLPCSPAQAQALRGVVRNPGMGFAWVRAIPLVSVDRN